MTKRGFTLIELLVIAAIISLLSSVTLTSLNTSRVKARNNQRLELVHQYRGALELARTTNETYPIVSGGACLGAYPSGTCGNGLITTSPVLDAALSPHVQLVAPPPTGYPIADHFAYETCTSSLTGTCRWFTNNTYALPTYYMSWYMEGVNQKCGPGVVYAGNAWGMGRYTACLYPHY